MKKLIAKFLVFSLILGIVFIPVNYIIDPYNIFHWDSPVDNGVEPNKNFIKTKYVINNPDKFDSFLFGSSRAGFMDIDYLSELTGDKWYDMASSEAVVKEHVNTLKVLLKNGVKPKNVFVMVDDIAAFVDPAMHVNMLYRVPYPTGGVVSKLEFYVKYCDLFTTAESLNVIKEHISEDPDYADRFRRTGTERLDKETYFDPTLPQFQEGYWADYYEYRVPEALDDMRALVELCKTNNIKLTVVTNPLYYLTYERAVQNGYLDYIEGLADITEFYNFSSLSEITLDYMNYYETSHFTPDVSRMMIAVTQGRGEDVLSEYSYDANELALEGFGVRVDKDNINDVIAVLKGK